MNILPVISGDLLEAHQHSIGVICQQTNCCTVRPHGLSAQIAEKLGINSYAQRSSEGTRNCAQLNHRSVPGTVDLMTSSTSPLIVANFNAQYAPGPPGKYSSYPPYQDPSGRIIPDTAEQRLIWFQQCCQKLYQWLVQNNISQVGVPYLIGCGLARGNWDQYQKILQEHLPQAVIFKLS